jgi:hypothetical protein
MPMVIYSPIAMSSRATMKREKAKSTGLEDSLCRQMRFWLRSSAVSKRRAFSAFRPPKWHNRDIPMTGSSAHEPPSPRSVELKGLSILLVEDSWHVGKAMKGSASCVGSGGGRTGCYRSGRRTVRCRAHPRRRHSRHQSATRRTSNNLIDRLLEQRIPVIIVTGYAAVSLPTRKVEAILEKPVSKERLLESCARSLLGGWIDEGSFVRSLDTSLRGISIVQDTPPDENARSTVPPSS